MDFDKASGSYKYSCPCGDEFEITLDELTNGEDLAHCPSCTLIVRVIYDPDDFPKDKTTSPPQKVKALVPKHDD